MTYPLFHSAIDLAHGYWKRLLQPGDWAIDATCGTGRDSLALAQALQGGGLIGIDIQEEALVQTRALTQPHPNVHLFHQSHETFPEMAYQHPIRVIVYNLGYLPRGNKELTTQVESTLASVKEASRLLMSGGALSITCYPGHPEGGRELEALLEALSTFSTWNICHHTFCNRHLAPSLILAQQR